MSTRDERIAVFESTKTLYETNEKLKEAVKYSSQYQKFYADSDKIDVELPKDKTTKIVVSKKRTFEASQPYAKSGKKTAILNFASATTPGGGVVKGSSAQEECLCRVSTLYPCLDSKQMWNKFYEPHRESSTPLHDDDVIYTPDVTVFKTDTDNPTLMPDPDWYKVNVITCAAPNLKESPRNQYNMEATTEQVHISDEDLYALHVKRARKILSVAVKYGVECLILGAFGCGAFRNDPKVVAKAYKDTLKEFNGAFDTIEFAVYCGNDDYNYKTFNEGLK